MVLVIVWLIWPEEKFIIELETFKVVRCATGNERFEDGFVQAATFVQFGDISLNFQMNQIYISRPA